MNFFDKLFGKNKVQVKVEQEKSATNFSAITMTQDELNKLKVGDTVQLGVKPENKENYELKWINANDNHFGIKIFDCRDYAVNMISTSQNEETAKIFLSTRIIDGKEFVGKFPNNAVKTEVNLNYYCKQKSEFKDGLPDGILAKAQSMEQKWDIYKYANLIYYVRSWTGELIYMSNYIPTENGFAINLVVLSDDSIKDNDPDFELKVVDFLVHSHILNMQVPHPIPISLEDEPQKIAKFSYSMFGNRGYYATYE